MRASSSITTKCVRSKKQHGTVGLFLSIALAMLCMTSSVSLHASDQDESATALTADVVSIEERLGYIQTVLTQKLIERRTLGDKIAQANEQDKADFRRQADSLTADIAQLRETIEHIAIGGIDTTLFAPAVKNKERNWRTDVALIAQPVIDSLKEVTEKPRRIKSLNELINTKSLELETAETALQNIAAAGLSNSSGELNTTISNLNNKWHKRKTDAENHIDIAKIQLESLAGNERLSTTIYKALIKFSKGRGLTLGLAILAAVLVWWAVSFLMNAYRRVLLNKREANSRTRYRLAKYSVQALRVALILIAVFIVFYERHDVLLLGLLILFLVGFALSAKHLLPRYVKEARLLLNLGSVREGERVVINNLPWRVESINMYSVFRNPELNGFIRLPLAELGHLCSRPIGVENWFPTAKGDFVLIGSEELYEVISQNPDTVELRKRGGAILAVPSPEFYSTKMTNLTRSGTFGTTNLFGIDYQHQSISTSDVPVSLAEAITNAFKNSDLADAIKDIQVELMEAGSSSLNYWIFVTIDSSVARSYYRIQRIVQSACIARCGLEQWSIPFPHVSIVQKQAANENSVQKLKYHTGTG